MFGLIRKISKNPTEDIAFHGIVRHDDKDYEKVTLVDRVTKAEREHEEPVTKAGYTPLINAVQARLTMLQTLQDDCEE